jgi:hypothetical protein
MVMAVMEARWMQEGEGAIGISDFGLRCASSAQRQRIQFNFNFNFKLNT